MQQIQEENYHSKAVTRGIVWVTGLIWVAGLLFAGSDSAYMPWLNILGALMFFCASMVLGRVLPQLDNKNENLVRERSVLNKKYRFEGQTMTPKVSQIEKRRKINPRVVLGV